MDVKRFQKRIENFICEVCGTTVKGGGYTNHCPKCLWSKHVDVNPGDRGAVCRGLMEPVGVEKHGDVYDIVYHCRLCGKKIKNKSAPEDDIDVIIKLSARI